MCHACVMYVKELSGLQLCLMKCPLHLSPDPVYVKGCYLSGSDCRVHFRKIAIETLLCWLPVSEHATGLVKVLYCIQYPRFTLPVYPVMA